MTTYSIRDWSKHFENNRTRELKEMRFVIVPNKQDGDGYTELLDHPNGAAHYGAWCALVQVASKCEPRGVLIRNVGTIPQGGAAACGEGAVPHDPRSLSRLTRIPATVFEEVLPRLVLIGWLTAEETQTQQNQEHRTKPQHVGTKPHPPAEKRSRIEENGIEKKNIGRAPKEPDARSHHPALIAIREVKGRFPNKDVWDLVIATLGEHPDVPRMRECWLAWRAKNFAPENLGWLVDWYVNGIPEVNRNGTRNNTASERNVANIKASLDIIRERTGEHHSA